MTLPDTEDQKEADASVVGAAKYARSNKAINFKGLKGMGFTMNKRNYRAAGYPILCFLLVCSIPVFAQTSNQVTLEDMMSEELENYDEAIRDLSSALTIERNNSGLYSERQLPLIDELIDLNSAKQDWGEVDNLVESKHSIFEKIYGLQDARYLTETYDYGQWKLRLLEENLLQLSPSGLIVAAEDLSSFYDKLISNLNLKSMEISSDLIQFVYNKSVVDLGIARSVAYISFKGFEGTADAHRSRRQCQNERNHRDRVVVRCYNVQVENPAYPRSQVKAKLDKINWFNQKAQQSIELMKEIRDSQQILPDNERTQLDLQIRRLETEYEFVRRTALANLER